MNQSVEGAFAKWGLVPLRLAVGVIFLMHGSQKIFVFGISGTADILRWIGIPGAAFCAVVLMIAEFGGGLSILTGVFARFSAAALAFEMVIAIFTARIKGGFFTPTGYEFEMLLCGACLTIAVVGSGPVSFDRLLMRSRAEG
jgi:putative oxidoreductase